jgi:hypothetical protein
MESKSLPNRSRDTAQPEHRAATVATPNLVRSIVLAMRSAGVSFLKIARALDAAGIGAPRNGRWQMSTVYRLLEADPIVEPGDEVASASSRNRASQPVSEPPRSLTARPRTGSARYTISHAAFKARFSPHLTHALLSHGIDAPERLLFMSEAEIGEISGVGKGASAEIKLYRNQFLPGRKFDPEPEGR